MFIAVLLSHFGSFVFYCGAPASDRLQATRTRQKAGESVAVSGFRQYCKNRILVLVINDISALTLGSGCEVKPH